MYTDEDLYQAAKAGIFEETHIDQFRRFVSENKQTQLVDEENFRLISGFNDIFVSIAAIILLISAGWVCAQASPTFGFVATASLAWLLSIFFVKQKQLALPAILLLIAFVLSAIAGMAITLISQHIEDSIALFIASATGIAAAWMHWRTFRVPITIAAAVATLATYLLLFLGQNAAIFPYINLYICIAGLLTFMLAMAWDAQDTDRKTRKSDVAFWLHLLAAPLIVHPIFAALGILDGNSSLFSIAVVILIYILLAIISIAVDRRALMVSSLMYVLFAFSELFNTYGMVSSSLAISGLFISATLLFLSAAWHQSRQRLLNLAPPTLRKYLPPVH